MRTFSLFLIAIGAILAFAVNAAVDGIALDRVGIIVMIVGVLGLALGMFRGRSSHVERTVADDGRTAVTRSRTSSV